MRKKDSKKIAAELFDATCRKENCHPDFVHSDNGEPMKGITLCAFYYQLGIIPSFSRPGVSDDNPYIESFFKTTKYQAIATNVFVYHALPWYKLLYHGQKERILCHNQAKKVLSLFILFLVVAFARVSIYVTPLRMAVFICKNSKIIYYASKESI